MITMRLEGMGALQASLNTLRLRTAAHYQAGVREAAEFLLEKSNEVVPFDTGYLKSTGYATVVGVGFFAKGEVGYTAEYALYVHENVHHHFKGGKMAKYLSWSAMVHEREIAAIIRRAMEPL